MSNKAPRSPQEIQNEYQQLAFKAGNLQYSIAENQKDLNALNSAMRDLTLEFNSAQEAANAAEEEAAKALAEAPPSPPKLEVVPAPQPTSGAV